MASSLALPMAALPMAAAATALSGLQSRLTNPLRATSVAPHVARSFKTSSQMRWYNEDDGNVEVEHRSDRYAAPRRRESDLLSCVYPMSPTRRLSQGPGLFSDVLDPLSPTRSLSQLLNLMDQFMGVGAAGWRRGWDVKEDDSVLFLRLDMPGLGREDVKVSVELNTLTIKGEGEKESEEEEKSRRRYSSRLNLPPNLYKLGEIEAVMKNGVLKVVVPKVKGDEMFSESDSD